jgi:hypothetical protein
VAHGLIDLAVQWSEGRWQRAKLRKLRTTRQDAIYHAVATAEGAEGR